MLPGDYPGRNILDLKVNTARARMSLLKVRQISKNKPLLP